MICGMYCPSHLLYNIYPTSPAWKSVITSQQIKGIKGNVCHTFTVTYVTGDLANEFCVSSSRGVEGPIHSYNALRQVLPALVHIVVVRLHMVVTMLFVQF